MRFEVTLNGTAENPFAKMGLTQNPFPQIAEAQYAAGCLRVQALGGEPIRDVQDIRERLKGFSEEFVGLCCARFEPGKMVRFAVEVPGW